MAGAVMALAMIILLAVHAGTPSSCVTDTECGCVDCLEGVNPND